MPDQEPQVLQCHKCQKRLRYSGKKPYISCPGCGESIPVVDNIQEDGTVHEVVDTSPVHGQPVESVWHVARGDERFGPFTNEQLLQGISSRRISANDFLWEPGMSEWKQAKFLFPRSMPPDEASAIPTPAPTAIEFPWADLETQPVKTRSIPQKTASFPLIPTKPVPMHQAIIYCIWALWAIIVFLRSLYAFADFSHVSDGTVYTNQFGPRSISVFLFANLFACAVEAVIYAVFAAIPTFLIWNYYKLKSTKNPSNPP